MSSTKGKTLYFNNKSMDYVTFGKKASRYHTRLGDGLQTVKESPALFLSYRLAKRIKFMFFSNQ
ncbi:MAG: hypothetical protein ACLROH_00725 [Streptococcus sp.]